MHVKLMSFMENFNNYRFEKNMMMMYISELLVQLTVRRNYQVNLQIDVRINLLLSSKIRIASCLTQRMCAHIIIFCIFTLLQTIENFFARPPLTYPSNTIVTMQHSMQNKTTTTLTHQQQQGQISQLSSIIYCVTCKVSVSIAIIQPY